MPRLFMVVQASEFQAAQSAKEVRDLGHACYWFTTVEDAKTALDARHYAGVIVEFSLSKRLLRLIRSDQRIGEKVVAVLLEDGPNLRDDAMAAIGYQGDLIMISPIGGEVWDGFLKIIDWPR